MKIISRQKARGHDRLLPYESVDEWLSPIWKKKSSSTATLTSKGPNQLLKWKAMAAEADCFVQAATSAETSIKVIFANAYLMNDLIYSAVNHSATTYFFLDLLIENYPCYPWEGEETDIRKAVPFSSIDDLLENNSRIQPSYAAKIRQFLQNRHLAIENFIIIDFAHWELLWSSNPEILDLKNSPLKTKKEQEIFFASHDPRMVKKIIFYHQDFEFFTACFKHFQGIQDVLGLPIDSLRGKFLQSKGYISNFGGISYKLSTVDTEIKENKIEDYLTFSDLDDIKSAHKDIKKITFVRESCDSWDYSDKDFPSLKNLILCVRDYCEVSLSLENLTFHARSSNDDGVFFSDHLSLMYFEFFSMKILKIKNCPELIFLESSKFVVFSSTLPKLKYLKVYQFNSEDIKYFPAIKCLEVNVIRGDIIELSNSIRLLKLIETPSQPLSIIAGENTKKIELRGIGQQFCEITIIVEKVSQPIEINIGTSFTGKVKLEGVKDKNKIILINNSKHDCTITGLHLNKEKLESKGNEVKVDSIGYNSRGKTFFSLENSTITHKPSGDTVVYDGRGDLQAGITHQGKELYVDDYRIWQFDEIIYKKDKLIFSRKKIYKPSYLPLQSLLKSENAPSDWAQGTFSGKLQKGQEYPLPASSPIDLKSFFCTQCQCNKDVKIGYRYDTRSRQVYVFLLQAPAYSAEIEITYHFFPDPNYDADRKLELCEPAIIADFPVQLKSELEKKLKGNSALKFLFDTGMSRGKKLQLLKEFCSSFKEQKSASSAPKGSLQLFLDIIKERCGVCEQLAQVFMVLARAFIDADIVLITNEIHAYCEMYTQDGQIIQIDLGGGERVEDKKGLDRSIKKILPPRPERDHEAQIRFQLDRRQIFDWASFKSEAKPALLYFPKDKTVYEIRKSYFTQNKIAGDYIYIDNPADLDACTNEYKIESGHKIPIEGPLSVIGKKGGIVFINFNNFSKAQRLRCQALCKNKNIKVVGFLAEDAFDADFNESFQVYCLPQQPPDCKQAGALSTKTIDVDLYYRADWYEDWVADLIFTRDGKVAISPQSLLKESKAAVVYHVYRPPNDPAFSKLIEQINLERRFRFNGKWVNVPEGFAIVLHPEKPAHKKISIKQRYQVLSPDEEAKGAKIYINRNNWHTLFQTTRYLSDPEDKSRSIAVTDCGKLQQYHKEASKIIFSFTEEMPPENWDHLQDFLEKENLEGFTFQKADIHNIKHITSSDPDFTIHQLGAPLLIDFSEGMDIKDIAFSVTPHPTPTNGVPAFIVKETHCLKALSSGKKVILKCKHNPPPSVLQGLLPLLLDPPHLEWNGERIELSGELVLLCGDNRPENIISDAQYRQALLDLKLPGVTAKTQEEKVDKLLLFFKAADFVHGGASMPEDSGKCWLSLSQMLRILCSDPIPGIDHLRNPLKGLELFNYEESGEEYAYLNVIGKYLFDTSSSDEPIRLQKYAVLLEELTAKGIEPKYYTWRLLNTCDGATLRELLGDSWLDALQKGETNAQNFRHQALHEQLQSLNVKYQSMKPKIYIDSKMTPADTTNPKLYARLNYLLETDLAPVIVVKGEAGVGKSHYLDALKSNPKYICTVGLANIKEWLEKGGLWLLDELNTEKLNTLDYLEGIYRGQIYHDGQWYTLTKKHKIVAAVNPESYPGRFFHQLLRRGRAEFVKLPKPEILIAWLSKDYGVKSDIAKTLLVGAELYKHYQPLIGYSYRNLQSVAQRYLALRENMRDAKEEEVLYHTLYGEFGVIIADAEKQVVYKQELRKRLSLSSEDKSVSAKQTIVLDDMVFPKEFGDVEMALEQALLIRNQIKQGKSISQEYKRGVLIQGMKKLGKWTFLQKFLQKKGLTPQSTGYYITFAGDTDFRKIAIQALKEGAILIVKNFNFLTPEDQIFLSDLLMNIDEKGVKVKQTGLMVFGLYSTDEESGYPLSPSTCNRLQPVKVPEIAKASWEAVAEQRLTSNIVAQQIIAAYLTPRKPYFRIPTAKDIYGYLHDCDSKNKYSKNSAPMWFRKLSDCLKEVKENKLGVKDEKASILCIELFIKENRLTPPTPRVKDKNAEQCISLCLYRLWIKVVSLEKEYKGLKSEGFWSKREKSIKNKKIIALKEMIHRIFEQMASLSSQSILELGREMVTEYPEMIQGINILKACETEQTLLDLFKFYDASPSPLKNFS